MALQTAHGAPETAALTEWAGYPWLGLNTVYTYDDVYTAGLDQYGRNSLPFFLIESTYEDEHGSTRQQLREQAYGAILSGATGQVFGNNPIWHFDGPGIFEADTTWQQALGSEGSLSMMYLGRLFNTLPWWTIDPGSATALLVSGRNEGANATRMAFTCDRATAIAYLPTSRKVTIDLAGFSGEHVALSWYDPSTGASAPAGTVPRVDGSVTLDAKEHHDDGSSDWVLVARAR